MARYINPLDILTEITGMFPSEIDDAIEKINASEDREKELKRFVSTLNN